MPDLAKILQQVAIPVKISCVVTSENAVEISNFLAHCRDLGVSRVVLRKLFGEVKPWMQLIPIHGLALTPKDEYRHNRVRDYFGMEVTLWDFEQSTSKSINLFSSGVISSSYLLTKTQTPPTTPTANFSARY